MAPGKRQYLLKELAVLSYNAECKKLYIQKLQNKNAEP
jgi:hypothetical protein